MSVSWASRRIWFLRNYGPIPADDNMYYESICRQNLPAELL